VILVAQFCAEDGEASKESKVPSDIAQEFPTQSSSWFL
jgi:hypothetical protein